MGERAIPSIELQFAVSRDELTPEDMSAAQTRSQLGQAHGQPRSPPTH